MFRKILLSPYLKEKLRSVYFSLPTSVSAPSYALVRSWFLPDRRRKHFESVFAAAAAAGVEGDYLEFGVYQGSSFIMANQLARKYVMNNMRFFAFDSFQGLPDDESETFVRGTYQFSKSKFTNMIEKAGVDMDKVVVVDGFFSESLTNDLKGKHALSKAAIINIDSDLYVSAKDVLKFLDDLVQPGTFLIFDDWNTFVTSNDSGDIEQLGERKAFREWPLSSRFDEFYESVHGKAFLMRPES